MLSEVRAHLVIQLSTVWESFQEGQTSTHFFRPSNDFASIPLTILNLCLLKMVLFPATNPGWHYNLPHFLQLLGDYWQQFSKYICKLTSLVLYSHKLMSESFALLWSHFLKHLVLWNLTFFFQLLLFILS